MTENKVFAFLRDQELICPGDHVAAAVSGGPDSVALLLLLDRYRSRLSFTLSAVHVHHGIRQGEADRDQAFVEALCRRLGVPLSCYRYEVPTLAARWRMGLEEAGRIVRREAFQKEKTKFEEKLNYEKKTGSESAWQNGPAAHRPVFRIALGHHQNDVAETMLFHLCRGTGLKGLASIQPEAEGIIRPLLCLGREEIESFLEQKAVSYVTDSTNLDTDAARNRIRHHILPVLTREVNKETVSHMAAAAMRFSEIQRYLSHAGEKTLQEHTLFWDGERMVLSLKLVQADPVEQAYALQEAMEKLAGSAKDLGAKHVGTLRELFDRQVGRKLSLPYDLTAERTYEGVELKKKKADTAGGMPDAGIWPLRIPGVTKTPIGTVKARVFGYGGQIPQEKKYTKWFDYDKIGDGISLRTRREGDYLRIAPDGHRKLLRRYFSDRRIPAALRTAIPLIAAGSHIAWIVGERISEAGKVTEGTGTVLELTYEEPG